MIVYLNSRATTLRWYVISLASKLVGCLNSYALSIDNGGMYQFEDTDTTTQRIFKKLTNRCLLLASKLSSCTAKLLTEVMNSGYTPRTMRLIIYKATIKVYLFFATIATILNFLIMYSWDDRCLVFTSIKHWFVRLIYLIAYSIIEVPNNYHIPRVVIDDKLIMGFLLNKHTICIYLILIMLRIIALRHYGNEYGIISWLRPVYPMIRRTLIYYFKELWELLTVGGAPRNVYLKAEALKPYNTTRWVTQAILLSVIIFLYREWYLFTLYYRGITPHPYYGCYGGLMVWRWYNMECLTFGKFLLGPCGDESIPILLGYFILSIVYLYFKLVAFVVLTIGTFFACIISQTFKTDVDVNHLPGNNGLLIEWMLTAYLLASIDDIHAICRMDMRDKNTWWLTKSWFFNKYSEITASKYFYIVKRVHRLLSNMLTAIRSRIHDVISPEETPRCARWLVWSFIILNLMVLVLFEMVYYILRNHGIDYVEYFRAFPLMLVDIVDLVLIWARIYMTDNYPDCLGSYNVAIVLLGCTIIAKFLIFFRSKIIEQVHKLINYMQ